MHVTADYKHAYESWKTFGQRVDEALLDIWRLVEPDASYLYYYDDNPQSVVNSVKRLVNRIPPRASANVETPIFDRMAADRFGRND